MWASDFEIILASFASHSNTNILHRRRRLSDESMCQPKANFMSSAALQKSQQMPAADAEDSATRNQRRKLLFIWLKLSRNEKWTRDLSLGAVVECFWSIFLNFTASFRRFLSF